MNAPSAAQLRAETEGLRDELAAAVLAVDGVARLEPTLRNALRRLQTTTTVLAGSARARSAAEGIELHRRGDTVDVHVDVATDPGRSAASTARDVRRSLEAVLGRYGLRAGLLTVAVLSIER